jgi:hypothetical protein
MLFRGQDTGYNFANSFPECGITRLPTEGAQLLVTHPFVCPASFAIQIPRAVRRQRLFQLLADPKKPITLQYRLIIHEIEDPRLVVLSQKSKRDYGIDLVDHIHYSFSFALDYGFTIQQFL